MEHRYDRSAQDLNVAGDLDVAVCGQLNRAFRDILGVVTHAFKAAGYFDGAEDIAQIARHRLATREDAERPGFDFAVVLVDLGVFGDNFGSRDAALAGATATRVIREESRLSLNELSAWFAQAGAEEMPGMTIAIVERVYSHLTRTNGDGRASIRDLRRWYISFGKRALADGLTAADLERELVPSKVS